MEFVKIQMSYRELTEAEKEYLAQGGRVFVVGEQNEVYIIKGENGQEKHTIRNHGTKETIYYETWQMALDTAPMIASLSEDTPMVEGEVIDWR
jgi:hypothetical protein